MSVLSFVCLVTALLVVAATVIYRTRWHIEGPMYSDQPCGFCGHLGEHVIVITAPLWYGTRVQCSPKTARHGVPISSEDAALHRYWDTAIMREKAGTNERTF